MKKIILFALTVLISIHMPGAYAFTTDLVGNTAWYALLKGANFDPYSDTQASKAGTEIVGNATHPSFYVNYDDNGTTTGIDPELDDILSLRIRIGDETKTTHSAYAFFGVDADNDGVLDVFFSSGSGSIAIYNAGGDSNTSPSTTSLSASTNTYPQSTSNYNFAQVSVTNDPDWDGNNDLNGDTKIDVFISFSIPIADLDALLVTQGITFTQDTPLRFVSLTATQINALNSDFNGVDRSSVDDWTQTFASLGIISDPVNSGGIIDTTPPAAPTVNSQTSHTSTPTITGTYPSADAAGGFTVQVNLLTYTLGIDFFALGDNWNLTIPAGNALSDNTYSISATATDGAANSSTDTSSNELVVDTTASTATSTITALPTQITADGSSTSAITVQLKYANGDNLTANGGSVVLSADRGSLSSVSANGNGTYTATLTSTTTAGLATITGTLDGNAITDGATVDFIPGAASNLTSTITASPASITANGVATSSITVTLKDANGNNLSANGGTVALSTNLGSLGGVTANGNGTYSAILTSSIIAGTANISGTLDGNAISDTAGVSFIPGGASPATTTVTASLMSITADGSTTSTITVQLKDANGNNLTANGGTVLLSTDLGTLTSVTANGNGTYTATLTSATTAGTAAVTGTLDGNAIADSVSIAFTPDSASAATSTITASPTSITANGSSISSLKVQLKDANGNDLSANGGTVALSTDLGSLSAVSAIGDGSYTATLTSVTTVGTATISGTLDGNSITDTASVDFSPASASVSTSTVTALLVSITADGVSTSDVTVQLKDVNGNNLTANGGVVALSTNLGTLSSVTANGDGTYTATLTSSTTAGTATISATLDGNAIADNSTVDFVPGVASTLTTTITASPTSITANGSSTSSLTVQLKDANGNDLSVNGGTVVLSTSIGSISTVTANGNGTYTATLTSTTTTGTATVSGTLDGGAIVDTASVAFVLPLDTDNDGISDTVDLDDDNDGIPDSLEGDGLVDSDSDLVADSLDLDSDNDGLFDIVESGIDNTQLLDADNDGRIDNVNPVGVNGLADSVETSADSGIISYNSGTVLDTDNDTVADFRDLDSDNDGIPDVAEAGGNDADNDGIQGTGVPVVDADGLTNGSGLVTTDTDTDTIPDHRDLDADNDGVYDIVEAGGVDSISDGMVDGFVDNDGNGFDDAISVTPLPVYDTDADGIPDFQDNDDTDNDGIPDSQDQDDDNDGIPDSLEGDGLVDSDSDGIPDSLDLDSDNDGLFDLVEAGLPNAALLDTDNDGRIDPVNSTGSNGIADLIETSPDSGTINFNNGAVNDIDGDGVADYRDLDSDNDGVPDVIESGGNDADGNGLPGNGTPSVNNAGLPAGGGLTPIDTDSDGQPDHLDLDSDGDGIFDLVEAGGQDIDQNGMVDSFVDNDANGFDDALAALPLAIVDSDADGIPDLLDTDIAGSAVIHTGVDGIGQFNIWLLMLLATLITLLRRLSVARLMTAIALFVLAGQGSAEQNEAQERKLWQNIYLGAGAGYSIMAPETAGTIYSINDDSDTAGKIYIGIDFSDSISAELSYNDLGTTTLSPTGEIDYTVTALYGLYYLYDHGENDHIGPALYLKAGLGNIDNSANVPYVKDNSIQLSFGLGLEYGWENGLAVRADAESFDDDASLFTVGLLYRFGNKAQPAEKAVVAAVIVVDTDGDGVVDGEDQCPETPKSIQVDYAGCEIDSDNDGVVDSNDQCPGTVAGATANANGCAIFETTLAGVNFEVNSADLTAEAMQVLDKAALALIEIPSIKVEVQAHTDSKGKKENNQALSEARAMSVVEYLIEKGVDRDRLIPKGFGEETPVASNETAEGRAQNRRVVFSVIK